MGVLSRCPCCVLYGTSACVGMQISSCFHISATFSTAKQLNGVLFRTLLFASSGHCNETSAVLVTTATRIWATTARYTQIFTWIPMQHSMCECSVCCSIQTRNIDTLLTDVAKAHCYIVNVGQIDLDSASICSRSICPIPFWLLCTHEGVPISIFYHQCLELNCFIGASVYRGTTMGCSLITRPYRLPGVSGGDQMGCLTPHMFSHNTSVGRHVRFVTDWTESPVQIEKCNQLSDCSFGTAELGAFIVYVRLCHLSHHSQDSPAIVLCSSEWLCLKGTEPFLLP